MDEQQPGSPQEIPATAEPRTDQPAERRHVRWFLLPLGIVAVLVCVTWLGFRLLSGPPDPLRLIQDLRDPSRQSWQQAYAFVELLQDPRSTDLRNDPTLCRALADTLADSLDQAHRDPAAVKSQVFLCRAVGEFHVADGLPELLRAAALREAEAVPVRCAALESIAVLASHAPLGDRRDHEQLVSALTAAADETSESSRDISSARIAATAAFALGVLGGDAACDTLRHLLDDPRPEVRYNAATGLARHADTRCIPVLVEMLTTAEHSALAANESDRDRSQTRELLVRNAVRAALPLLKTARHAEVSTLREAIQPFLDAGTLPAGLRTEVQAALAELDRNAVSETKNGSL